MSRFEEAHPLDTWFQNLRRIDLPGGEGRVIGSEDWPELNWERSLCDLAPEEVRLIRCVLQIDARQASGLLDDHCEDESEEESENEFEEESEEQSEDDLGRAVSSDWLTPLDTLLEGATLQPGPPSRLFSLNYAVGYDGMMGGSGGWQAVRFNADWVLIEEWSSGELDGPLAIPLGFVSSEASLVEGAALILEASSHRQMNIFYWEELSATDLCPEDAYRLLLAITGRAPPEILVADRETLAGYRREDMELGFPEVAQLLAKRGIWV
jgi:hypothetical protein